MYLTTTIKMINVYGSFGPEWGYRKKKDGVHVGAVREPPLPLD